MQYVKRLTQKSLQVERELQFCKLGWKESLLSTSHKKYITGWPSTSIPAGDPSLNYNKDGASKPRFLLLITLISFSKELMVPEVCNGLFIIRNDQFI